MISFSCLFSKYFLHYQQKARDNRAALRINKVQLSNDTMKRQQHQQPADPFDPSIPMDTELIFKDPLKHKESEHEQEWKLRQVIDSLEDSLQSILNCETEFGNHWQRFVRICMHAFFEQNKWAKQHKHLTSGCQTQSQES